MPRASRNVNSWQDLVAGLTALSKQVHIALNFWLSSTSFHATLTVEHEQVIKRMKMTRSLTSANGTASETYRRSRPDAVSISSGTMISSSKSVTEAENSFVNFSVRESRVAAASSSGRTVWDSIVSGSLSESCVVYSSAVSGAQLSSSACIAELTSMSSSSADSALSMRSLMRSGLLRRSVSNLIRTWSWYWSHQPCKWSQARPDQLLPFMRHALMSYVSTRIWGPSQG